MTLQTTWAKVVESGQKILSTFRTRAIIPLLLATLVLVVHYFVSIPLAEWFSREGHGGGITIPSFILENKQWIGITLIVLCALIVGKYLLAKHQKEGAKKKEGDVKNPLSKTTEKEKERKWGVLYMDNVLFVLISLFGACWSVWWILFRSTLLSKEVIAVVIGVIFLSEGWNIFANTKESLKWYQWIIRLWILGAGAVTLVYYGFSHLTFGIR